MLGENFEEFVTKNKKERTDQARTCVKRLRKLSKGGNINNPDEYLDCLEFLLELVNKNDAVDKISLEDIDTTEKEIRDFEKIAPVDSEA